MQVAGLATFETIPEAVIAKTNLVLTHAKAAVFVAIALFFCLFADGAKELFRHGNNLTHRERAWQ